MELLESEWLENICPICSAFDKLGEAGAQLLLQRLEMQPCTEVQ